MCTWRRSISHRSTLTLKYASRTVARYVFADRCISTACRITQNNVEACEADVQGG